MAAKREESPSPERSASPENSSPEDLLEWPAELRALPLMRLHDNVMIPRSVLPDPIPALRKLDIPCGDLDPYKEEPMLEVPKTEHAEDSGHHKFLEASKALLGSRSRSPSPDELDSKPSCKDKNGGSSSTSASGMGSSSSSSSANSGKSSNINVSFPAGAAAFPGADLEGDIALKNGLLVYLRPGTFENLLPNRYVDLMELTQGGDDVCPPMGDYAAGEKLIREANLAYAGSQALEETAPESMLSASEGKASPSSDGKNPPKSLSSVSQVLSTHSDDKKANGGEKGASRAGDTNSLVLVDVSDKSREDVGKGDESVGNSLPIKKPPERNLDVITTELKKPQGGDAISKLLVFDSHFESGNLAAATLRFQEKREKKANIPLYELIVDEDTNSNGNTQWYFFAVRNTQAKQTVDFSVLNLGKSGSLYQQGMRPLCYSLKSAKKAREERRKSRQILEEHAKEQDEKEEQRKKNWSSAWKRSKFARGNTNNSNESLEESLLNTNPSAASVISKATGKDGKVKMDKHLLSDELDGWHRCGTNITYEPTGVTKGKLRTRICDLKLGDFFGADTIPDETIWKYATPTSNLGGLEKKFSSVNTSGAAPARADAYDERMLHRLGFRYTFEHDDDVVFFAYSYPYTFTRMNRFINDLDKEFCYQCMLCRTLGQNWVDVLTVTDRCTPSKGKQIVFVTARVHPGETCASFIMEGFLKFLTSREDKRAQELRRKFIFKCVPMLNPDGVVCGNYRTSLVGSDLNRRWKLDSRTLHPQIWYTKRMIRRLARDFGNVCCFVDLHGHSKKLNWFTYGCHSVEMGSGTSRDPRVLPYTLRKISPTFDLASSNFAMPHAKDQTARIVVYRDLGVLSYTVEASLGGGYKRNQVNSWDPDNIVYHHFNASDYAQMGKDLANYFLCRIDKRHKPRRNSSTNLRSALPNIAIQSGEAEAENDSTERGENSETNVSSPQLPQKQRSNTPTTAASSTGFPDDEVVFDLSDFDDLWKTECKMGTKEGRDSESDPDEKSEADIEEEFLKNRKEPEKPKKKKKINRTKSTPQIGDIRSSIPPQQPRPTQRPVLQEPLPKPGQLYKNVPSTAATYFSKQVMWKQVEPLKMKGKGYGQGTDSPKRSEPVRIKTYEPPAIFNLLKKPGASKNAAAVANAMLGYEKTICKTLTVTAGNAQPPRRLGPVTTNHMHAGSAPSNSNFNDKMNERVIVATEKITTDRVLNEKSVNNERFVSERITAVAEKLAVEKAAMADRAAHDTIAPPFLNGGGWLQGDNGEPHSGRGMNPQQIAGEKGANILVDDIANSYGSSTPNGRPIMDAVTERTVSDDRLVTEKKSSRGSAKFSAPFLTIDSRQGRATESSNGGISGNGNGTNGTEDVPGRISNRPVLLTQTGQKMCRSYNVTEDVQVTTDVLNTMARLKNPPADHVRSSITAASRLSSSIGELAANIVDHHFTGALGTSPSKRTRASSGNMTKQLSNSHSGALTTVSSRKTAYAGISLSNNTQNSVLNGAKMRPQSAQQRAGAHSWDGTELAIGSGEPGQSPSPLLPEPDPSSAFYEEYISSAQNSHLQAMKRRARFGPFPKYSSAVDKISPTRNVKTPNLANGGSGESSTNENATKGATTASEACPPKTVTAINVPANPDGHSHPSISYENRAQISSVCYGSRIVEGENRNKGENGAEWKTVIPRVDMGNRGESQSLRELVLEEGVKSIPAKELSFTNARIVASHNANMSKDSTRTQNGSEKQGEQHGEGHSPVFLVHNTVDGEAIDPHEVNSMNASTRKLSSADITPQGIRSIAHVQIDAKGVGSIPGFPPPDSGPKIVTDDVSTSIVASSHGVVTIPSTRKNADRPSNKGHPEGRIRKKTPELKTANSRELIDDSHLKKGRSSGSANYRTSTRKSGGGMDSLGGGGEPLKPATSSNGKKKSKGSRGKSSKKKLK